MAGGRVGGRAGLLLTLLLPAQPPDRLTAQVADNRAALYLHPTDAADARALWVNPAGMAAWYHASVHLDITVRDPGARGRLGQLTAGFSSRGLGFSYQRDLFDGDAVAHTYRLGVAGGARGLAAGLAAVHYREVGAKATAWDVGVVYALHPSVTVGGVVANIGEPDVRGVDLPLTIVPGVTVAPFGPTLAASGHARLTREAVVRYGFGVRWSSTARVPVGLLARLDTDRRLRRESFVFGVSVGAQNLVGTVVTTSGDVGTVDAASLYGVVSRSLDTR
jgi:hypothetical protein